MNYFKKNSILIDTIEEISKKRNWNLNGQITKYVNYDGSNVDAVYGINIPRFAFKIYKDSYDKLKNESLDELLRNNRFNKVFNKLKNDNSIDIHDMILIYLDGCMIEVFEKLLPKTITNEPIKLQFVSLRNAYYGSEWDNKKEEAFTYTL